MKILITGCAGFIGSNITEALLEAGHEVGGIDNFSFGNKKNIISFINDDDFVFDEIDFNNLTKEHSLSFFDILIHCATFNIIYAQEHETETFINNALNTINLFQKFSSKVIYLSTSSVYNNSEIPTKESSEIHTINAYDTSKRIAELYLQERGNYTTLRLSNVYGYNQRPENIYCGAVGKMVRAALNGDAIKIHGTGYDTRDYTFVDDVVDAVTKCVEMPAMNTEINIATGVETDSLNLAKMICGLAEVPHKICFVPERKIDTVRRRCLDISKAKELLGWSPRIEITEGLTRTIAWQRDEYFNNK